MAINPNDALENRHTLSIGQTGSGKTHFLRNHAWVKRRAGRRLIIWDPYESQPSHYAKDFHAFGRMLAGAVRSGKGFSVGIAVHPSAANFERFCRMVWLALDGRKTTVVIAEELGDVSSPGKAAHAWGRLVRVGRKYGAVLMPTTQRPQEIDKTLFTQVSRIWCGLVSPYDQVYVEKHLGLERGALANIEPGPYKFAYKHGASVQWGGPGKKIKV